MLKLQKIVSVLLFSLFLLFFKVNITNASDFNTSIGDMEKGTSSLVINVDGIDAKTKETILYIPFRDLDVKADSILTYSKVIETIQESVNIKVGYNKLKVVGFSDDIQLTEGFSETSILLKNNEDIHLPKIAGLNKTEAYSITGSVILSEYPKLEIPSDLEYDIKVAYGSFFYEKLKEGGFKKLGFFNEEELEGYSAGSRIDSNNLQYLAQKSLDSHFGMNQYKIVSRKTSTVRNLTQSAYNNYEDEVLCEFETTKPFSYIIKPQVKDPKVSEYLTYICDNFYVEKVDSENTTEATTNSELNEDNYSVTETDLEKEPVVDSSIKPGIKPEIAQEITPMETLNENTFGYNYDYEFINFLNDFDRFVNSSYYEFVPPIRYNNTNLFFLENSSTSFYEFRLFLNYPRLYYKI